MAILKEIDIKYGNIRHTEKTPILHGINIYCPICDDIHDGVIDEYGKIVSDCDCDIDDWVHTDVHDFVKSQRDDFQAQLDNTEEELVEAIEERDELIEELEELRRD